MPLFTFPQSFLGVFCIFDGVLLLHLCLLLNVPGHTNRDGPNGGSNIGHSLISELCVRMKVQEFSVNPKP